MIFLRVNSFSCSSRAARAAAMVLNAPASSPISSRVVTVTRASKSPSATRREALTRARTGVDSRREMRIETADGQGHSAQGDADEEQGGARPQVGVGPLEEAHVEHADHIAVRWSRSGA